MISFLKRSKSTISFKGSSQDNDHKSQPSMPPPPPLPVHSFGQKSKGDQSTLDVSMPDLRFSRLDLDAHLHAIGQNWRISGGSVEDGFQSNPKSEQRKSRLNIFGSRLGAASNDELVTTKKAGRNSTLLGVPKPAVNGSMASRSTSALNVENTPINDRRSSKMGYNTMPKSSTNTFINAPQQARPANVAPLVIVDKKQQKKNEKLRVQQEKERMKQMAKEMKEQEKRAKSLPKSAKENSQSPPLQKSAPPKRPEIRRPLQSSTNVHQGPVKQPSQSQSSPKQKPMNPASPQKQAQMNVVVPPYDPARFPNPHAVEKSKQAEEVDASDLSPMHTKALMTTSSSEGGTGSTSTAGGRRPSSESNTTVEFDDASEFSEEFKDASTTFANPQARARPTRDAEHQERVQSRLSMTIDGELQKNENVVEQAENPVVSTSDSPILPAVTSQPANHVHRRVDSNASTFSAMLMASRPGGSADRAVDAEAKQKQEQQIDQYRAGMNSSILTRSGLVKPVEDDSRPNPQPLSMQDRATSILKRVREAMPNLASQYERTVQPELVSKGDGWSCLGVGDPQSIDSHWHSVKETIKVERVKEIEEGEEEPIEPEIEQVDVEVETHYNDLFELLFTATTPDVLMNLLSYLDIHDIKAVRQTCSSIRLAIGANREIILSQHLSNIGYRTWTHIRGTATSTRARQAGQAPVQMNKDPCPLSLSDLEGFIIAHDLLPEYAMVGQEFARAPQQMDEGMARLAKATTRAHNRVLTRLRIQPTYKLPPSTPPSKKGSHSSASPSSSRMSPSASTLNHRQSVNNTTMNAINRHNSYYDFKKQGIPFDMNTLTIPAVPSLPKMNEGFVATPSTSVGSHSPFAPSSPAMTTAPSTPSPLSDSSPLEPETKPTLLSPWKPGRAAHYRVWVPAKDPSGWLSDEELAECEQELYKSGSWPYLKRGDIVWDTAVGDQMNEGKYVFDGNYLRDLSYAFDCAGHLPSWLNVIKFSPSYWHNVIRSTTPQPVVYLDISPWKDQILSCLRLVQDHVDTFSGNGARYSIAKWLYRSAANVTSGQIISRVGGELEIADDQWAGKIVIETDGTAESAKMLVGRCAGSDASEREKAALLATVMGDANEASKMSNTFDTYGGASNQRNGVRTNFIPRRNVEPQNAAWVIMRERCKPGLIWIRPLSDREKVF